MSAAQTSATSSTALTSRRSFFGLGTISILTTSLWLAGESTALA